MKGVIGMLKQVDWLFFDVGSTLVDESRANEHRILDAIKGTIITYDQAYSQAVQLAKQKNAHPLKALGLPLTPWHSEDERVYPQAANCLAELHKKYKIGVIANQIPGTADRMKSYGLYPYLDLIIASAEEGVEKPDLRIFEIAFERAKCRPENAVMIGDRIDNDIVPAKQKGMITIWIRQGFGGMAENLTVEETPDYCVHNLQELADFLN